MSQIEKGYFINDNDYAAWYDKCCNEFMSTKGDKNYCDDEGISKAPVSDEDANVAAGYFDEPIDDISFSEFQQHPYEQTFVKRSVESETMRDIFLTDQLVTNWFENIKNDYISARTDGDDFRKSKEKSDDLLSRYSRKMCCSIKALYIDSRQLETSKNLAVLARM